MVSSYTDISMQVRACVSTPPRLLKTTHVKGSLNNWLINFRFLYATPAIKLSVSVVQVTKSAL